MDLQDRAAQPPATRRRVEQVVVAALCAVLTTFLVTLSSGTVRLWWGRDTIQVAVSAAGAALALVLCGVAARNADRSLRTPDPGGAIVAYGAISIVTRER